jgi:Carboxypeptidase regulatory-like domain
MLLAIFLFQETWTLAGVTGNVTGIVRDTTGAPLAGVTIEAVAPSQKATTTTDATGHFVLLSLAPDTYTISLTKAGFQSTSFPGVSVFADQTQQLTYTMTKALRVIARVTSSAGASLVKAGVGGDLYSVNSAQAAAASALGGGGNLNSAYSAMASVPGIQVSQGGMGMSFNASYVRGQNFYYTGYEYDGIPVNRAFDNYNSSTESTVGLQELQVYTGGGPSTIASSGTAGFINQVIKTGTFPGFATANLGIGTPQFYHQASVEIGGSTPDRTFSYYVGLLGYNQAFRFFDNSFGAGYMTPGGIFSGNTDGAFIGYGLLSGQVYDTCPTCVFGTGQGVKSICPLVGAKFSTPDQGCWQFYNGVIGNPDQIADRENVINLHMGIPKRNGLRDDVQLLWSGSSLTNYFIQSPNDLGPGYQQAIYSAYGTKYAAPTCGPENVAPGLTVNGCTGTGQIVSFLQPNQFYLQQRAGLPPGPYTCPSAILGTLPCAPTYFAYADGVAYNTAFGAPIATSATNIKPPSPYYAPATPPHPFDGPLPLFDNSLTTIRNDTGVTKLQYTYALSQSAYLRAYGYTFYSDWMQVNPIIGTTGNGIPTTGASAQYQLMTHTSGGALDFQDQINDQNLISLDGNYTTAGVVRFNNSNALGVDSQIGYMSHGAGGYTCYGQALSGAHTGSFGYTVPCLSSSFYAVNFTTGSGVNCAKTFSSNCILNPTWTSVATSGPVCPATTAGCAGGFAASGTPAAKAHATWDSLWQGNAAGSLNTVRPVFTNASLSDQFRPNDKVLINASIRYDDFTYDLPDSLTAADAFYANMTANYTCVQASTNRVLTQLLLPGQPPPAQAQYVVGNCNTAATVLKAGGTGWVHPNGTMQDGVQAPNFTAESPNSYTLTYWEPRFSATFTANPDTVFRVSAGRFTQPPISASVQYLGANGDDRSVWNNTMGLGFYSPFHPIPGISSGQYDLSWEQHFKGTDMSLKLTPFFTWVTNWQQQTFIGANFATQVPVGVNRNEGVEFQFNKGDFTRNGLSGQFAMTYTNSKIMFQNVPLITGGIVPNQIDTLNQAISQYNALTKAGGGSPCYQANTPVSCSTPTGKVLAGYDTILNPYYNAPKQGLLDPGGWYNPYSTALAPSLNGTLASYISPWVAALIVNWRHDKLAITPSFSFQSGGYYGSPLDVNGVDPRSCVLNSAATNITKVSPKTNPLQCNYLYASAPGEGPLGYLYIPNPQTGRFAFGNMEQPNSIVGNLQMTYDLSPKIRLTVLGASLLRECFGGTSAPWTAAYPPGYVVCGYAPAGGTLNSTLYPSNFYNGTGVNDFKANGVRVPSAFQQSYIPGVGNNGAIGGQAPPINVYFNAQFKI